VRIHFPNLTKNETTKKNLSEVGHTYLLRIEQIMTVGNYSPKSIKSYIREVRFFLEYFPDQSPDSITQEQIEQYVLYLRRTFNASNAKCRSVAHSVSFFYKQVLKKPYELPSKLYPKKAFKLPNVMTQEQMLQLINACETIKQRAIVELFYSTGIRLEECSLIKITDIDSKEMRVKVCQGKGRKDRYTILSKTCLNTLRSYFKQHRPKVYLFEGQTPGEPMHVRSIQHALHLVMVKAQLAHLKFNTHTLRHSFATHMLDNGSDIHTIKELLGHSKIETTMVYLHLQSRKRYALVSPLDALHQRNDLDYVPVNQSSLWTPRLQ
jgi:site-specific recombinase XerD